MKIPLPDPAPLPSVFGSREHDSSPALEAVMVLSLARLQVLTSPRPSLGRRLWHGITCHARLRATEWFGTLELILFGYALWSSIPVFDVSPNMAVMAQWMREETWGELFLLAAFVRLFALGVNGTFRSFRFSPHVRAASGFFAIFLWSQVVWAMILSGVGATGAFTYTAFFLLEVVNFILAIRDAGRVEGRRAGDVR